MSLLEMPGIPGEQKGKGGLWGKIAGGIISALGAAVTPFVPPAGAAGIAAGTALAGGAAPFIGEAIDPSRVEPGVSKPSTLENVAKQDPQMTMALLDQGAKDVVGRQDIPHEQAAQTVDFLNQAKQRLMERQRLV